MSAGGTLSGNQDAAYAARTACPAACTAGAGLSGSAPRMIRLIGGRPGRDHPVRPDDAGSALSIGVT